MRRNPIVREVSDFMLAPILLFAFYVQFHADYGPGGGFQAGVIFGAGLIVYALVHGLERTKRILPPAIVRTGVSAGLLIFIGVGFACLLLGGNFLDYDALLASHAHEHHGEMINPHGQHVGILIVEFGVAVTVASVMLTIFYGFATRREAMGASEGRETRK